MITRIQIRNFKSLSDFDLDNIGMFTCLIGLNGAGKTTLLQALDFLGHLVSGQTDFRGWSRNELLTAGEKLRTIAFRITFKIPQFEEIFWAGKYNVDRMKFSEEFIFTYDHIQNKIEKYYLILKDGRLQYEGMPMKTTKIVSKNISDYNYKGSALSAFTYDDAVICAVRDELQGLKSLELLSPETLRHASKPVENMGIGGEGLAGFLYNLSKENYSELNSTIKNYYHYINNFYIKNKKFGWKQLLSKEVTGSEIPATHTNDGFLRIIAILTQKYSKKKFLLFDEIENGINQELIEKLLDALRNFNGKQVMVTTHSALVLNYLSDEEARQSVVLLFKDKKGSTRATRFFELPEIAEKLRFLGPGEAMGDTDLVKLTNDLAGNAVAGPEE